MNKRLLSMLLAIILTLGLCCPAALAADSGLAAFTGQKTYSDGLFSDVKSGDWYAAPVKTVYEKGIMDGMGGGKFQPNTQVSWAMAVTIAARLHAAYNGNIIESGDPWYAPYADYAGENGLLPSTVPEEDALSGTSITRQELAFLFRGVLHEEDLPAINDSEAAGVDSLGAEFKDAMLDLYRAGIFTGNGELGLDGQGKATRAQIATVVARLLSPAQRVAADSRQNQYMKGQLQNMGGNHGWAASIGDTGYFLFNNVGSATGPNYLLSVSTPGEAVTLYESTSKTLDRLSVGQDGMLYFLLDERTGNTETLMRIDPATGKTEAVYSSRYGIESYLFYDGELYVVEDTNTILSNANKPQLGRVRNGKMEQILEKDVTSHIYAFQNVIYYIKSTSLGLALYGIDLETEKHFTIISDSEPKQYGRAMVSDIAFTGGTVWYMLDPNSLVDDTPSILMRKSLVLPEACEKVRDMFTGTLEWDSTMQEDGITRHMQSKWNIDLDWASSLLDGETTPYFFSRYLRRLFQVGIDGELTEVGVMPTQAYEAFAMTPFGNVFALCWPNHPWSTPDKTVIQFPDGKTIPYYEFLGLSYNED